MDDTVNDDLVPRHFKQSPPIACPHPVFRLVIRQLFHISFKVILQAAQALHDPPGILWRKAFQILLGLGF